LTLLLYFDIFNTIQKVRINNQIIATELRVIGDEGENLGVMTKDAALSLAKEKGLDLIEISAKAVPPVARIMSYDKHRYQEEKKLKKQYALQKNADWKQIQIGIGTAQNDLGLKAKKAEEFLNEGHVVEVFLVLRGREKANRGFAMEKIGKFLKMITVEFKVLMHPKYTGRGIAAQISK